MRRPLWIAAAAAGLAIADTATAQVMIPIQARFGRQTSIFVQPRIGPHFGIPYYGPGPSYTFVPGYGFAPVWQQPPIIINNFIQTPIPIVTGPNRPPVIPVEFEDPPIQPAVKGKAPPKPFVRAEVEEPPKRVLGRADADRLVETGREAFATGQYGRALELFRKAAEITPNEPSAHYLIAQAQFALGKYREAVTAIGAGMALRADWPEARFSSRDLYGDRPETFDQHLADLRRAAEAFPNDPTLLFLLGHQLWFDGKLIEAKPLIGKARALAADRTPAAAFRVEVR
jgi:tetratricopeptide (TPR) repeat protein